MTADVTEKVARALTERDHLQRAHGPGEKCWHKESKDGRLPYWREVVTAALSVLSDPEVLAGMAEVLVREIYPAHDPDECCDEWQRDHAERVATALADWLRGQG